MRYRMLIGGKLVEGAGVLDVVNPATGESFESCARGDLAQLNQAVRAAKDAFPRWGALPIRERGAYLCRLADALEARAGEVARLLTSEQGKPIGESEWEVAGSAACLRYTASLELPDKVLHDNEHEQIIQYRTAHGVVAAITPWNVPLLLLVMKVAPGLLVGNTIVAKPAPTTPLTTLLLGEIAKDVLPPGVLNTLVVDNDLGAALTSHRDVAKISFTGSTETGKRIMSSAAGSLKRVTLELGGNDAAIVLDDVDVKEVAPKIYAAATLNCGQICLAAKRVYAPRALYDDLSAELARLAKATVVGDGQQRTTQLGPVQNRRQYEKLKGYLAEAGEKGTVVAGGSVLDRPGFFVAPTIVRDIPPDSRLVREEQFGPVLPILPYDDINEAVAQANDSDYGLGGTIWARDVDRAFALARQIDTATLWINRHMDLPFDVPIGGLKQSGIGLQQGQEGLEDFTQLKIINMARR
jgi:acyl-CoA reductase-like NAD-dependent aldehyde dehydrogenase